MRQLCAWQILAMTAPPWMPLYVSDFLADTEHLGATETGIYIRLILHCWQHGSIPRDERKLALISHVDTRLWRQHRSVLQFFDVVDASTMTQKRVLTELLRYREISNKRKASAMQKHLRRRASDMQMQTHACARQLQSDKESTSSESNPVTQPVADTQQLINGAELVSPPKKGAIDGQPGTGFEHLIDTPFFRGKGRPPIRRNGGE